MGENPEQRVHREQKIVGSALRFGGPVQDPALRSAAVESATAAYRRSWLSTGLLALVVVTPTVLGVLSPEPIAIGLVGLAPLIPLWLALVESIYRRYWLATVLLAPLVAAPTQLVLRFLDPERGSMAISPLFPIWLALLIAGLLFRPRLRATRLKQAIIANQSSDPP